MASSSVSITKQRDGWDRELVIQLILELHRRNHRLSIKNLYVNRTPLPDLTLSRIVGRPTSRQELHSIACKYFGSWSWAMRECGLSRRGSTHNYFWNQEIITNSIRLLSRMGYPLTVKSIHRDKTRATTRLLKQTTNRSTTGCSLHEAARRYFGSWDTALIEAGLDIEQIKEKPFWSKLKTIKVIQALNREKIFLNASNIQLDRARGSKIFQIIKKTTGKGKVGRSLYSCAFHNFGSWDKALTDAGLNPVKIRLARFKWKKRTIRKILRALYESNVQLNVASIFANSSDKLKTIIINNSGRKIQGSSIYRIGRKTFGSWDEFLKYSGLTPSTIRKHSAQYVGDKEGIINIIHALHINEFELHSTAMIRESKKILTFLEKRFGLAISGYSILNASKRLYGSWDKTIWEAGLNPNEIRRRSPPHTTHLPLILYQVEDVKVEGIPRRTKVLGAPPKTPDQILDEREAVHKLELAVSGMNESDQDLVEKVFDAILEIHHYRDQKHLIQLVARRLDGNVPEQKIASLLEKLARNAKDSDRIKQQ
ncbi:MAG: hypothetical protein IPM57_08625 [Oligoflexia bacterium]|nr:hypothetical protein [Oligoflexia bacterium]